MHHLSDEVLARHDACLTKLDGLKRLFPQVTGFAVEETGGDTAIRVVPRLSLRIANPVMRQQIVDSVLTRFQGAQHVLAEPVPHYVPTQIEPHGLAIPFASWDKLDAAVEAIDRMYPPKSHADDAVRDDAGIQR